MSPLIPTDPDKLQIEFETIPEDTIVHAIISDFKIADKTDKNDKHYGVLSWEVVTPLEWEGRQLTDNYVGFQGLEDPTMSDGQRRRALEAGIRFNMICACIKLKPSSVPSNPIADDDVEEINQYLQDEFVGQEGDFSVSVDTYKGRKNNKIKMYLLPHERS